MFSVAFRERFFRRNVRQCLFTLGYTRARALVWISKFVLANQMRVWADFSRDKFASFMKTEKQIQILLLKVDPRFTFRNNFPQLATNVFVARQVDHARWKTGNIDQKQAMKQVDVFCISYFAALTCRENANQIHKFTKSQKTRKATTTTTILYLTLLWKIQ